MRVPTEFVHPPFFREGDTIEKTSDVPFPYQMKTVYFYYDIVSSTPLPWEQIEQSIPAVLELWNDEKEQLEACFAKRNRAAAREPMIRGLSYLIVCLFWLNGKRTQNVRTWEKEIEALALKPINCVERLQFIFSRCDVYHSFIQLSELFEEVTKLFYKQLAMMKKGMSSH
ncbi:hypothetical protein HNQ34_000436 [Anoxybacillus tepidamans]|uniref:YpoC-like domain-containing protein n=1 Tax=Anoxybacteroides tepidamans TaxID=265948 RepID=A0A7W8IMW4_9BACL|nr:hypothetical protein [Anoxybacillus tepidamans]